MVWDTPEQAGVRTWETVDAKSRRGSGSLAKRMCAGRRAQEEDFVLRTHLVNSIDNLSSWGSGQYWYWSKHRQKVSEV